MNKRTIIAVLVVLLSLLCYRLMFDNKTVLPATESTSMDDRSQKPRPTKLDSRMSQPQQSGNAPNAEARDKLTSEVVAGGRQWRLNFADQSLPPEVRQRIGYDLNLVFGHLPKFEIDTLPRIDSMPFPFEMDGRKFDRRVRFEGGKNRRPKVLFENDFGLLEQGSGESSLFVSKPVIEAYNKAIALEKANQVVYQQLDQFLARMSKLKETPIENVHDLFVLADDFKSAEADLAAVTPAGFAEGWGGKLYREPSILDVKETAGTPLEKYGSLVATTYAMSEGKVDDLPPLLFSNGQWRFLLQRPPT